MSAGEIPLTTAFDCPCCGARLEIKAAASDDRQPQRKAWEKPPEPMTPERAAAFKMPFGKYKELSLAEIGQKDPSYLEWGAKEWDRALGRAVRFHLETLKGGQA